MSPAECWRGDRLLQDDNWKESGWSSLAPVALGDSYIEVLHVLEGADYWMLYLKKRLCPSGLNLTDVAIEWWLFLLSCVWGCVCVLSCLLSDHSSPLTSSESIFLRAHFKALSLSFPENVLQVLYEFWLCCVFFTCVCIMDTCLSQSQCMPFNYTRFNCVLKKEYQ